MKIFTYSMEASVFKIPLLLGMFMFSNIYVNAQNKGVKEIKEVRFLIKTDVRAVLLQPKLSFEGYFNNGISAEVGVGRGWSSESISRDGLGDRFGYTLLGIGPAKSLDLFGDMKYTFKKKDGRSVYLGLGYLNRYSHFTNKFSYEELSEYQYQHYHLSETVTLNMIRVTVGKFNTMKNSKFGFNPYFALMVGNSKLQYNIDTVGASSYVNYSPTVLPKNEKKNGTTYLLELGCKLYFDMSDVFKQDDEIKPKRMD